MTMVCTPQEDAMLHHKLPIGDEEHILGFYKHHWFAYAQIWIVAFFVVLIIMGLAVAMTTIQNDGSSILSQAYRPAVMAGALLFSVIILAFAYVPIFLRMHEQLVLTNEALFQILRPSLFTDKVSQLSLEHLADVSVRQDFFGNIFGYGHITIETPGEQDNFEYYFLPNPHAASKEIIEAQENFSAALQSGQIRTTFSRKYGYQRPEETANAATQQAAQISPEEYQEFLKYQQAKQQFQQDQQNSSGPSRES